MSKLSKPVELETAFARYTIDELLGEGGAGRVYGGAASDGTHIALKVLSQTTADKRKRFKNETAFLARNTHPNIVTVIDHGIAQDRAIKGPFYVMRRYDTNLRNVLARSIAPGKVLEVFAKVLDGVEAAHLQGVVHRDLKPENILCDANQAILAVADFGVASFTDELLVTAVETSPAQRLANFMYAAPEQRVRGAQVGPTADIYALGLMLNEMFTGSVPHGTQYKLIADASGEHQFLDSLVAQMLRQEPRQRPTSIAELKGLIQRHSSEAIAHQRLSQLNGAVIREDAIDEPLASEPPKLVSIDFQDNALRLILDRPVSDGWIRALYNMGNYSSLMGHDPQTFRFNGNAAVTQSPGERHVQALVNHFKDWLPIATRVFREQLQRDAARRDAERKERLRKEREHEETRLRVLRNTRI